MLLLLLLIDANFYVYMSGTLPSEDKIQGILKVIAGTLQIGEKSKIKNKLLKCPIQKSLIRQVILKEGMNYRNGLILLKGSVTLTKKTKNTNKPFVVAQVNSPQIINLQIPLYPESYYTATVSSSDISYVQIDQKTVEKIFQNKKEVIKTRERKRMEDYISQEKQFDKQKKVQAKEKIYDRLLLPELPESGLRTRAEWHQVKPKIKIEKNYSSSVKNIHEKPKPSKKKGSSPKIFSLGKDGNLLGYSSSISLKQSKHHSIKVLKSLKKQQKLKNKMAQEQDGHNLQTIPSSPAQSGSLKDSREKSQQRRLRLFKVQVRNIIKQKINFENRNFQGIWNYRSYQTETIIVNESKPGDPYREHYFRYRQ